MTKVKLLSIYKQWPHAFHLAAITIISVLVLWPLPKLRFLHGWDDQWAVFNTYTEDGFTIGNLWDILTTFYCGQYAPVNQLYYTAMYYFFGYEPMYYHIGGIVIHIVNMVLVYYLVFTLSNKLTAVPKKNMASAFVTALLFAISPINLEPVAWVAATKVTLYALFYLLSILTYCRYLNSKNTTYYYITLFFFMISFGAKEQAVTLPLCLLLIDFLYKRDPKSRLVIYEKLPFFILALLFGFLSIQSQGKEIFEVSEFYPLHQRVLLSFYTVSEYLTKTLLPVNLSYLYPFPFQIGDPVPLYLWIYPIAMIFIAIAYFKILSHKKWLNFGLAFFIIHIILVSNIMSLARFSIVADRYAYIACIGLYFIIAYLVVHYLPNRKFVIVFVSLYLTYFMAYTHTHSTVWANAVTLKQQLKNSIKARSDYEQWKKEHLNP